MDKDEMKKEDVQPRKMWQTGSIYRSKNVPVKLVDGLVAGAVIIILVLVFLFAKSGGYTVTFDTKGGSEVPSQKVKYGALITMPEEPVKAGYSFAGWIDETAEQSLEPGAKAAIGWNFEEDTVEEDMTLSAYWNPAEILVKFDTNGGTFPEEAKAVTGVNLLDENNGQMYVLYGEAYGELPEPVKDGAIFAGWEYSGNLITKDTVVATNGEHVLTAAWK